MNKKQRKRPWLPDGSEVWIGIGVAAAIGFSMVMNDYPWWSYLVAVAAAFLGCVYGIQLWSEDDRQYWKAIRLKDELTQLLEDIKRYARQIQNITAKQDVNAGVNDARLIMDELLSQKATRMYGGLSQLEPHVRRMRIMIEAYVDIQGNPQSAGDKGQELLRKAAEGCQGFSEEMARMLVRAKAGDVFNLTTNAELLRSLRNLLGQNTKENQS